MLNENRFCLYFHIAKDTDQVFYVGIGTGYRPRRFSGRNEIWQRTVDKHGFYVKIVHKSLMWNQACDFEKMYIKFFGRKNIKTGILANLTEGGDGTPGNSWNKGSKRTPEQRKRIYNALKGRKVDPVAIQNSVAAKKKNKEERARLGIPENKKTITDKVRAHARSVNKGRKWTEDRKRELSKKLKGRIVSEETKQKMSTALAGRKLSDVTKQKLSQASKKQWAEKRTWFYK